MRDLPDHTTTLWAQLDQERRHPAEHERLTAEQHRGRGRPAIGARVPLRLPDWRIRTLDQDAEAVGVGRAELIRALITAARNAIRDQAEATGTDRIELIRALMRNRTDAAPAPR